MLIRDIKILQICVIVSLLLQLGFTNVENDLSHNYNFYNIRLLQKLDPELQSKIDEVTKNPAFEDPGLCSVSNPTDLSIIKPDDIAVPLNSELSLEESKRFSKYFQDEYISNSSILDSPKFGNYTILHYSKVTTNYMSLIENKLDDNFVTVVFHESRSMNSTNIKTYFMTSKANIVMDSKWVYDFQINDDFSFCYFCNSNSLKSQVCKVRFKAKTWGARNTIELKSQIYVPMVESDEFTVLNSKLEGGPMTMRSDLDTNLLCFYCIIPFISCLINRKYFLTLNKDKQKRLSGVGYCISCCMVNSYHLYMALSFCCLNINVNIEVAFIVFFVFFCIGWVTEICFYATFSNGADNTGEPKTDLFLFSLHIGFYCITIPLVCTVLGPFVLYKVYMNPTMYFLLGQVYIIPILFSAAGKVTVNDHFLSIFLNSILFAAFPYLKSGPGFWTDKFDFKFVLMFMTTQIFYAIVVGMQQYKGSRFFLPHKYRTHTYTMFKNDLDTDTLDEAAVCGLCKDSIYDSGPDSDGDNTNYKYKDFDSNCYLKLECGHIFHPNCLIRSVKQKNECPTCQAELPPYGFDD